MSVIKIIAEGLSVPKSKVTSEAHLRDDLGVDSLDVVEILIEIEEGFNIEIQDEQAEKWETVGDVIATVEGLT
jgi:acyl carrier protein